MNESIVDPITLAVIQGSLQSTVREMRNVLVRSGRSPIIVISTDFSNSIFTAAGEQVIQGDDQPVHLGSMQIALQQVQEYYGDDISEGDVIYVNDPTFGGGHQADMTMFKPIFVDGVLTAWAANRSHVSDAGGPVAGGYNPMAREIYAEGLRLPPVKIYEGGRVRRDVVDLILTNVRTPRAHRGDMGAQYGAVTVAETRIAELCEKFGRSELSEALEALLARGEAMAESSIRSMKAGVYQGASLVEYPGTSDVLEIRCVVKVADGYFDVSVESPPQVDRYINSYFGNTISAIYAGVLSALPKDTPHNGGAYRRIRIDLGLHGTLLNAEEPAPASMATSTPFDSIMECVESALAEASPERAVAGWSHFMGSTLAGIDPRTGESFSHLSTMSGIGGAGAMWGVDGWSCCSPQCTFGGMSTGNVEEIELQIPVQIHRFELAPDTEGPGRLRGGFGVRFVVEVLCEEMRVSNVGEGHLVPPPGRLGAPDSKEVRAVFSRQVRRLNGSIEPAEPHTVMTLRRGDRLESISPGGGGIGEPSYRDKADITRDVKNELISPDRAMRVYGWKSEG